MYGGQSQIQSLNYSQSYKTQTQTQTVTQGLTDIEGAKQVARRIFDTYDKGHKGQITNVDCVPMIVEAYKSFNQKFLPSHQDTQSYFRVLDRNGDNKITYDDIESLCIRYLCSHYQSQQTVVQQAPPKYQKRVFTPEVEAKLDVARRLFNQFDTDKSGLLDQNEVLGLLKETYRQMGIQNVNITEEDVRIWMKMVDTDGDGQVSLSEYEDVVIKSLRKAGFTIESQHIVFNK